VFWIHASNAARFEQGYRDIASKIQLPGRDDPKVNILWLVSNWLCHEKNGQWLMILDNADDNDVFFRLDEDTEHSMRANDIAGSRKPLESFLPQTPNGSILVTSRNSTAAMNLVGVYDNVIRVEPMDEGDALALLKTRIPFGEPPESEAKALVQALECIPLAITHAAAYIRMREPRVTISTYLQLFRESATNQANLLSNEDVRDDLRRDHSIRHAVITTWQISFNQIRKTKSAATDLLALISMFDRQGIPEYLLHDNTNRLQFEDAIAPLISFALIRAQVGQQSFEMHSLVQLSMREWLKQNKQLEKWRKESVKVMARAFPSGEYKTWIDCQVLLPHSKEVMSYVSSDEDEVLNRATVAGNTAWYLHLRGEYATAEEISRDALDGREKVLGPEHPDTLTSVSNLGSLLKSQGKYEEAETMHRRALEGYEKALGLEHPYTLTSVSNLGSLLGRQAKYEEAEAMHRRALEGREKMLGLEHPDTFTSVSNLGSLLESQGKYEEAEAMHRRALEGREKMLGLEHPDTFTSVSDLGSLLESQGKYKEAEAMHRRALEGHEKILGPEHPYTLTSVSNLGLLLERQGKYEEAETMHRRALEGSEKVLGLEHPDTLTSVSNLGSLLKRQSQYEEAEAMYRRDLEGCEKILGPEHPDTLTSVSNLGSLLESQGKYEEAEAMYRRDLKGCEKVLELEHPDTLTSVNKLGSLLEGRASMKKRKRCIDER
jgi:tetratricopeptide (TPR) repeat protein